MAESSHDGCEQHPNIEERFMSNPGKELSSIDFASMIGGPLTAVVSAQTQAAKASVDFIKEIGFSKDDNGKQSLNNVKFSYTKASRDENMRDNVELVVPLLTIVPIPYIRVEDTTIEFNAKINSVATQESSSSLGVDASLSAKHGWGLGGVKLKVNTSYQKSNKSGSKETKTYSLAVRVHAVQDEIPAGMEKVLNILEESIFDNTSGQTEENKIVEAAA